MTSFAADQELLRDPREALQKYFGFGEFKAGQEPVISSLLSGRDTLAVMPTGGGKSLCYQLPAMVTEGVTVVVSPLIALMKDQVDALTRRGIPATVINSTLSPSEQADRLHGLGNGLYKLVYVAPERFRHSAFLSALQQVPISLFAVDEAHCLSQWGHDFRPDYIRLSEALERLGHPQTAAFTATATPEVRSDIQKVLKLRDPFISISGFERPNLSLKITHCEGHREKYDRLKALVADQRTGIVYCATRKRVEEVSEALAAIGVKLVAYHGGMEDKDRDWAQNVFLDRSYDVAVATNAFGMGIDRPDVRFVAHFDIPGSVEAYYQEAGRAGRDGEPSTCELLFNYADTRTQEFFIDGNNPGPDIILDTYSVFKKLCGTANDPVTLSIRELADTLNIKNTMQVSSAMSHLSRGGYLQRFDIPGERTRGTKLVDPSLAETDLNIDHEALAEKERRDRSKLAAMVELCYDETTCRQQWILEYFGESDSQPCGACDNCGEKRGDWGREPDDDEFEIARKALAGVARTCSRAGSGEWEPRFGKGKIVQMLTGSHAKEIGAARLDELSTYGILKEQGSTYVFSLLTEMERSGLVAIKKTPYPLLTLTRRGEEVMKGRREFTLAWPDPNTSITTKREDAPDLAGLHFSERLFETLKTIRNEVAKEAGVPAFVVFDNKVLEFMTRLRPSSTEQALQIRGIGEVKAERYLSPFLEAIRTFED